MSNDVGSVSVMSLAEARKDQASDQSRLDSFGGGDETTYIGIVNRPNDDFEGVVDEIESRLSPPDDLFWHWLSEKQDGMSHDEAYHEVNYETRFNFYLRSNDGAQEAIRSLANRVSSGENLVLVCYCGEHQECHRYAVRDYVEKLLD